MANDVLLNKAATIKRCIGRTREECPKLIKILHDRTFKQHFDIIQHS